MKHYWKTAILIIAALIVLALIAVLSVRIFHSAQGFHLPGPEDRHMGERDIHSWMTVEEVAARYNTTPEAVFAAFCIDPEPGDEHLSLRRLKDKYGKSRTEMMTCLDKIKNGSNSKPGEPGGEQPEESSRGKPGEDNTGTCGENRL